MGLTKTVFGDQPSRGVTAPCKGLLAGSDDQLAIVQVGIVCVVGVVLQLSIAPTPQTLRCACADVIPPFRRINRRAIELVTPRQSPILGKRHRGEAKGDEKGKQSQHAGIMTFIQCTELMARGLLTILTKRPKDQ